jgi:hypothetical protein
MKSSTTAQFLVLVYNDCIPYFRTVLSLGVLSERMVALAIMECRDYCMEEGCNKGGRERESVILLLVAVIGMITAC